MHTPNCTLPQAGIVRKTKYIITHRRAQSSRLHSKGKAALDVNSLRCAAALPWYQSKQGICQDVWGQQWTIFLFLHGCCQCKWNTAHLPTEARPVFGNLKVWKRASVEAQAAPAALTLTWDSAQLCTDPCSQNKASQDSLYPPAFMDGYKLLPDGNCE